MTKLVNSNREIKDMKLKFGKGQLCVIFPNTTYRCGRNYKQSSVFISALYAISVFKFSVSNAIDHNLSTILPFRSQNLGAATSS
jgi:hypothetical protein